MGGVETVSGKQGSTEVFPPQGLGASGVSFARLAGDIWPLPPGGHHSYSRNKRLKKKHTAVGVAQFVKRLPCKYEGLTGV